MQIFDYSFISNQTLSILKENGVFQLSTLQRKVALVAFVVLGCVLTCYLFYRVFFKWDVEQLNPSQKSILDSHEIKEIEKEETMSSLSFSDYMLQKIDTKFKAYLLLLCDEKNLYNYADITLKNASSLGDARVVLIGDTHTMPTHTEITWFIINHFGRNDDIHLVEGGEGKVKRIFKHMETYGWDNMKLFEKERVVIKQVLSIRERLGNFPKNQKVSQEKVDRIATKLLNRFLFFSRKRTVSLIECINDSLLKFPDKKIFVTAGKGHFIEGDEFNILNHLPPEEKCALVMLKDLDPISEEDKIKYAESLAASVDLSDSV